MGVIGTKYNIAQFYDKYIAAIDALRQPFLNERDEIYNNKAKLYSEIDKDAIPIKRIPGLYKYLERIRINPQMLQLRKHERFTKEAKAGLEPTLYNIVSLILTYTVRDYECRLQLRKLNLMKVREATFTKILYTFYTELGNSIIQGYVYNLGRGLGNIKVIEYKRQFLNDYGEEKGIVDHGTSEAILLEIAQEQEKEGLHKYYSLYKVHKYITRRQFHHLMREYTYSKSKPWLPKWVVYYTDEWVPLIVWGKGAVPMSLVDYTFKPSAWLSLRDKTKEEIQESLKTPDDVLECTHLGIKNKLFAIKKLDKEYYKYARV